MKLAAIFLLALTLCSGLEAREKVIYGADDRMELINFSDMIFQELARSTAGMVSNSDLEMNKDGDAWEVKSIRKLGETMRLCEGEPFADQPLLSNCSGFLVADDVLVTAGHCYSGPMANACDEFSWVFDYKMDEGGQPVLSFPKEDVYRCKEVVKAVLDGRNGMDYAIIKLDRPVSGRFPLPVRTEGKVSNDANLTVIGHPWGLPSKITPNGGVLANDNPVFFSTSLDTFQGNSGSAVFNENGLVEGILVRGKTDARLDFRPGAGVCRTLNVCDQDGKNCDHEDEGQIGEDVTRITALADDLKGLL